MPAFRLSNGKLATTSGASPKPFRKGASAREHKLMWSFIPTDSVYTDAMKNEGAFWREWRNGSTEVLTSTEAEEDGHYGRDGSVVSVPSGVDNLYGAGTAILRGLEEHPSTYDGRFLVIEVESGTLGTGNTLTIDNMVPATNTKTDVSATRVEYEIVDVTVITSDPVPKINCPNPGNVSNLKVRVFWKDEEARLDDVSNNPWKAISPAFEARAQSFDVLRLMDAHGPIMNNNATHWDGMGQLTDQHYLNNCEAEARIDDNMRGILMRQGCSIVPWLSFAQENNQDCWINLPIWIGSPVMKTSFYDRPAKTGKVWFSPDIVDTSQTVSVTVNPTRGTVSIAADNKSFTFDASTDFTHTSGQEQENFTISYTDQKGDSKTFVVPMKIRWTSSDGGTYVVVPYGEHFWTENTSHFINHWAWEESADGFLDDVVASGFGFTRNIYLECANEVWNNGNYRFFVDGGFAKSAASAYSLDVKGGVGLICQKWRKHVEERLAARQLLDSGHADYIAGEYNLKWVNAVQHGSTDRIDKMYDASEYFWETIEGLTNAQAIAKNANFGVAGTLYYDGAFRADTASNAAANLTGDQGAAFSTAVLSTYFPSNTAQLETDVLDLHKENNEKARNINWNVTVRLADAITEAANHSGYVIGSYEGGNHMDDIYSGLTADSGFVDWWKTAMHGQLGADMVTEIFNAALAEQADQILCIYGGADNISTGQPWALGRLENADTTHMTAIKSFGRG